MRGRSCQPPKGRFVSRATFHAREPVRDDGLRQIPWDHTTRPDPQMRDRARQGLAAHIANVNLQDAIRALWIEDARKAREAA